MMHLAAFYQSLNPAGVLTQLNAVADQALYVTGKEIRVPAGLANLAGEACLSAATGPDSGQVQSPTLRAIANQDVNPIAAAAKFSQGDGIQWHADNPRALTVAEPLNLAVNAAGGAAADNYGLVWLADGAVKPTTGKIITVRAFSTIALAVGAWVNGPLTFGSVLPAGTYQVVGMLASGANLVAARLVFPGGTFRPGVPCNTATGENLFPMFRNGYAGVFGAFDTNQPPTLDALGVTDTSQLVFLDLIKTA